MGIQGRESLHYLLCCTRKGEIYVTQCAVWGCRVGEVYIIQYVVWDAGLGKFTLFVVWENLHYLLCCTRKGTFT